MSAFSASVNGCLARSRAGRAACETGRLGDWERGRERERGRGSSHAPALPQAGLPGLVLEDEKANHLTVVVWFSFECRPACVERTNERTNEEERTTTKRGEKMMLAFRPRGVVLADGDGRDRASPVSGCLGPRTNPISTTRRPPDDIAHPPRPPRPPDTRRPMRGIHCRAVRLPMKKKYI